MQSLGSFSAFEVMEGFANGDCGEVVVGGGGGVGGRRYALNHIAKYKLSGACHLGIWNIMAGRTDKLVEGNDHAALQHIHQLLLHKLLLRIRIRIELALLDPDQYCECGFGSGSGSKELTITNK